MLPGAKILDDLRNNSVWYNLGMVRYYIDHPEECNKEQVIEVREAFYRMRGILERRKIRLDEEGFIF